MFKFACSLIILLPFSPVTAMITNDEGASSNSSHPPLTQKQLDEETHHWFLNIPGRDLVQGRCSGKSARHMELEVKMAKARDKRYEDLKKEYDELLHEILKKDGGGEDGKVLKTFSTPEAEKKEKLEQELRQVNFSSKRYEMLMEEQEAKLQWYICIPDDSSTVRQRGIDSAMRVLRRLQVEKMGFDFWGQKWRLEQKLEELNKLEAVTQ